MAMDKEAFTMASRNTPVRDELVLSLDDIFPMLKSGEGIPVVKHTKRGQSDHRRLRLDTDDSTLEVFSTTASFINRKMSNRTYNLRMLKEVGPAASVPGGQGGKAATPGRTLVFVFRNRNLYVTVETRDVCAALVALFRPAGTGEPAAAGQSLLPAANGPGSGAITAQLSEDGGDSRGHTSSPLSPSSSEGPSVLGGARPASAAASRRASENAAAGAATAAGPARRRRHQSIGTAASERHIGYGNSDYGGYGGGGGGGGGGTRSLVAGQGEGGGRRARGRRVRHHDSKLKRSASETAGADLFDFDAAMTSSSDEEGVEAAVALASTTTAGSAGSSVERSQQRSSPASASGSPDPIMKSRMVGFGSKDLGIADPKPKRIGMRWVSRFTDSSEKKGVAAAAASPAAATTTGAAAMAARLKGAGFAIDDTPAAPAPAPAAAATTAEATMATRLKGAGFAVDDTAPSPAPAAATTTATTMAARLKGAGFAVDDTADVEEDAGIAYTAGVVSTFELRNSTGGGGGPVSGSPRGRRGTRSPLAVKAEDRLSLESLRRPASAPGSVLAPKAKESPAAGQDTPPAQHGRTKSRMAANSSPPGRHSKGNPPLGRDRDSAPPRPPTQQPASFAATAPLENEGEFEFAFSRPPERPSPVGPAAAAVFPPPQQQQQPPDCASREPAVVVDDAFFVGRRKIPPMTRPVVADPPPLGPASTAGAAATTGTAAAAAAVAVKNAWGKISRGGSRLERSPSPPPPPSPKHMTAVIQHAAPVAKAAVAKNGAHAAGAGGRGRGGAGGGRTSPFEKRSFDRSSSLDSLEVEDPDHRHADRPLKFGASASFSENDATISHGRQQTNNSIAPAPVAATSRAKPVESSLQRFLNGGSAEPRVGGAAAAAAAAEARGRGRHRDAAKAEGDVAVPASGKDAELAGESSSSTSPDLTLLDERRPLGVEEAADGAELADPAASAAGEEAAAAATRAPEDATVDRLESFSTSRTDSFGPANRDNAVSRLTIQTALSHDEYSAPSEAGTSVRYDSISLPFAMTPGAAAAAAAAARVASNNSRGSRGSRGSYDRRGSGATDCTSPGSPPGGAVGEMRASPSHLPTVPRAIPMISGLHLGGGVPRDRRPEGPSGFEELWAVLEPAWDMNASFGASYAPKVMLLGDIYDKMRSLQAAVASVCVRECGPVLGEVCGRCGRAWAVLVSTSEKDMMECKDALRKIQASVVQLIDVVERYGAGAVVRLLTLPLIGVSTAWEELLIGGEGGDLQEPCLRMEEAIAQLLEKEREGGGGKRGSRGEGGGVSKKGRHGIGSMDLRLPPCPSYWAKGQFDQLTPNRLADISTLLHEPTRFSELAELVTRASDVGPATREYSRAWDCVRRVEGPALGRELRRALSATLVAAGELLPLPRVPPPPPAYLRRERLMEQIEATILHPFLPLGIAGIGGASGSGKTVLAAAVVRDATVRCRFGDRVFWLHAGKGASHRLVSVLQDLADTVYAFLTDGENAASSSSSSYASSLPRHQRRNSGGGGAAGGGGDGSGVLVDPNLREPVRFRDEDQAVNYVADLCRGPLLSGLRCLVVLDDVHEREVVDALWKSGCQLLVTSPVEGLLQAVGAEATMAAPLGPEAATEVASLAAGEEALCQEAGQLVDMCHGCPLALAMSGAVAQAVLSGGNDAREYRKPGLATPRTPGGGGSGSGSGSGGGGGDAKGNGGGGGRGMAGLISSVSTLAAPVGAWVEQVVVGSSGSPPSNQPQRAGNASRAEGSERWPATVPEGAVHANGNGVVADGGDSVGAGTVAGAGMAAGVRGGSRLGSDAAVWVSVSQRVDRALASLQHSRTLRGLLEEAGPERDMPLRELVAALTELALQEADRILGGSNWALECYLSFALLPEGLPLPPPALEEFWRCGGDNSGGGSQAGGGGKSLGRSSKACTPVEVFEALRMVGRAGGGEGANGLSPHGLQRAVILGMAERHPEVMQKMARRRAQMLSRISSLVGTFEDDCWGLRRPGGAEAGMGLGIAATRSGGDGEVVDVIPSGLLGSRRPGPLSHGYGGFSRYDYLLASWDALPPPYTLASAAARYASSVRGACQATAAAAVSDQNGGSGWGGGEAAGAGANAAPGGWAAARALASVADLQALAGRRSEAIPVYEEACALLAAEAARTARVAGVAQKEQAARDSHHKVASMVQELAMLTAHFGREAPAIRLLQRAVEMHLSTLEASGVLVPFFAGGNEHRSKLDGADPEAAVAAAAATSEEVYGRGASITYRAVVDDPRPISSRLWLQSSVGTGPAASVRGGGGGNLPAFGRLDVVGTCVGDLGMILACTRTLQQEQKAEESAQLAEKVYPVLKEILGADHAFTKTALAAFVGQGIVDECWSQPGADGGSGGGHPALPSPTSRRRLARSYGGRGVSTTGSHGGGGASGRGGTATQVTAPGPLMLTSTLSDLSVPPSPLPEEFYARYSFSASNMNNRQGGHGESGRGAGEGGAAGTGGRPLSGSALSNNGSMSSGTEGDDGEHSDGGSGGDRTRRPRHALPPGRGVNSGLSLPRKSLNGGRLAHGWRQREAAAATGGCGGGGGGGGGGNGCAGRSSLEPASSRMQQELYFQHRTRRARAHAFLITAATRARLKNANRAEAGLFLRDLGKQAGANYSRGLASPDTTPQMARLTRRR